MTELPLLAGKDHKALDRAFKVQASNFAELYALGYDAYRLGTWLPLLDTSIQVSIPGASGHLWLDTRGIFRRELDLTVLGGD